MRHHCRQVACLVYPQFAIDLFKFHLRFQSDAMDSAGDIQTAAHIILALGVDGLAACKITEHEAMSVLLE